jgi:hypothetical protein
MRCAVQRVRRGYSSVFSAFNQLSASLAIQFSASSRDSKPLTYCIWPLAHWMKTRQPVPACAGTAFNNVISLPRPIRLGDRACIGGKNWVRRPGPASNFATIRRRLTCRSRSRPKLGAEERYARRCGQAVWLLRSRRERPGRCRAAEQRDDRSPVHSITSSASASSLSGTVRPSAFAVLRLITSSNLVGCTTGKSAGFSPLSTRPT